MMVKVRCCICCITFLVVGFYIEKSVLAKKTQINVKQQKFSNMLSSERIFSRKKRYLFFTPGSIILVSNIIIHGWYKMLLLP